MVRKISGYDAVYAVAFSPDNQIAVASCVNSKERIQLVDSRGVRSDCCFDLDDEEVVGLACVGSDAIVTVSIDGNIRRRKLSTGHLFWTVNTGKLIREVAFSHDGKWLVVLDSGNTIRVCDVEEGSWYTSFVAANIVKCVAISPHGTRVAFATDSSIYVRTLDAGTADHVIRIQELVRGVSFSNDGRFLALVTSRPAIETIDVESGETMEQGSLADDWFSIVRFSINNGSIIAGGSGQRKSDGAPLVVWDRLTSEPVDLKTGRRGHEVLLGGAIAALLWLGYRILRASRARMSSEVDRVLRYRRLACRRDRRAGQTDNNHL